MRDQLPQLSNLANITKKHTKVIAKGMGLFGGAERTNSQDLVMLRIKKGERVETAYDI